MLDRYGIRLVGKGGQGLLLLGAVLADAVAQEGKKVVMTQRHGAQQRGGISLADLVISDSEIDFPLVTTPDILLALTQESFDAYVDNVARSHTIIVDSGTVHLAEEIPEANIVALPIEEAAVKTTGNKQATNMVALGIIAELCRLLPSSRVKEALKRRSPAEFLDTNLKAFDKGVSLSKSISPRSSNRVKNRVPHK